MVVEVSSATQCRAGATRFGASKTPEQNATMFWSACASCTTPTANLCVESVVPPWIGLDDIATGSTREPGATGPLLQLATHAAARAAAPTDRVNPNCVTRPGGTTLCRRSMKDRS